MGTGVDEGASQMLIVKRQLESLLRVVELETDGRPVVPAGIRLKEESTLKAETGRSDGAGAGHIWRFKVESGNSDVPTEGEDKLVGMIREQLATLLDVCRLTHRGCPVQFDGFQFLEDDGVTHELYRRGAVTAGG